MVIHTSKPSTRKAETGILSSRNPTSRSQARHRPRALGQKTYLHTCASVLTPLLKPRSSRSVKEGTIRPWGAGEGRLSEQEKGQDQDRRRPGGSVATGRPHTSAAGTASVRVEEAPVGAGGFHIISSPLFSGLCCRPADPAKAHRGTLVLAFCYPSCGLGTWYWVLPDRISERVQGPDVSG